MKKAVEIARQTKPWMVKMRIPCGVSGESQVIAHNSLFVIDLKCIYPQHNLMQALSCCCFIVAKLKIW